MHKDNPFYWGERAAGPKQEKLSIGKRIKAMRGKKLLMFAFVSILAVVLCVGSTWAWFTASDFRLNQLWNRDSVKNFSIILVDDFDPPEDPPPPGLRMHKSVGAQNVEQKPGFVRLLVLPVFVAQDGTLLPAEFGTHVIIEDLNTTSVNPGNDWIDGGDGYFYYRHRLDPGRSTGMGDLDKNLFNYLHLASPMPEGYENAVLRIEVKCEAAGVNNYREGWWGIPNTSAPTNPPFSAAILAVDSDLRSEMP